VQRETKIELSSGWVFKAGLPPNMAKHTWLLGYLPDSLNPDSLALQKLFINNSNSPAFQKLNQRGLITCVPHSYNTNMHIVKTYGHTQKKQTQNHNHNHQYVMS